MSVCEPIKYDNWATDRYNKNGEWTKDSVIDAAQLAANKQILDKAIDGFVTGNGIYFGPSGGLAVDGYGHTQRELARVNLGNSIKNVADTTLHDIRAGKLGYIGDVITISNLANNPNTTVKDVFIEAVKKLAAVAGGIMFSVGGPLGSLAGSLAGDYIGEKIAKAVAEEMKDDVWNKKIEDISKDDLDDLFDKAWESWKNGYDDPNQTNNDADELGKQFSDKYEKYKNDTKGDAQCDFKDRFNPTPWNQANRDGRYHIVDPLVLDLDGDGIETLAETGSKGVLFDHNGDGIKTATGWVSKDDGLLVWDRNNDGIINSGLELFGDNTRLQNGNNAAHGFAALQELDSNGDGVINSNDAQFSQLRVWQDKNQDGISQSNELLTLLELGIESLDSNYKNTSTNLGNGNTVAQTGSYTKVDGSKGIMGDINFDQDLMYSKYNDKIELTEEQKGWANLAGSGRLRNLAQAAATSSSLADVLQDYMAANTKEKQLALLDELVAEWAKTDPTFGQIDYTNMSMTLADNKTGSGGTAVVGSGNYGGFLFAFDPVLMERFNNAKKIVPILDSFTGMKSEKLYYVNEQHARETVDAIYSTYESLKSSVYLGLLLQTRLSE